jgi:hypothetical protein
LVDGLGCYCLDAGDLFQELSLAFDRHGECLVDLFLHGDMLRICLGVEPGADGQVFFAGHDAEHAAKAAHAFAVGPVCGLASHEDGGPYVIDAVVEDGEPLVPLAARLAVALGLLEGGQLGAVGALVRPDPDAVDDQAVELGVGFEVVADRLLDGAALEVAGALAVFGAGPEATALDHLHECLSRGRLDRDHWLDRLDNMLPGAVPVSAGQIRMDDQQLVLGDHVPEHEEHGLAVLAAAVVDDEEGAPGDQAFDAVFLGEEVKLWFHVISVVDDAVLAKC